MEPEEIDGDHLAVNLPILKQKNISVGLLQGPIGPFFADFSSALNGFNVRTVRVLFNAGDRHFSKASKEISYTLPKERWSDFLSDLIISEALSVLVLYGDTRFYHRVAVDVATKHDIPVWCFEEGYVRPGYVTFEKGGNNAASPFPNHFLSGNLPNDQKHAPCDVGSVIRNQIWFAISYYAVKSWSFHPFPFYDHHRKGGWLWEMVAWVRAGFRKAVTKVTTKDLTAEINRRHGKRLILVPLQVAVDAQVCFHSHFDDIRSFIDCVLEAAQKSLGPGDHILVKHHPMDRGHTHYGHYIRQKVSRLNLTERVSYSHDVNLDELLPNLKSCIMINSTLGLACLQAGVPVACLGKSMLVDVNLAHDGSNLTGFIKNPDSVTPLRKDITPLRIKDFLSALIAHTQIPGSFYKKRQIAAAGAARKLLKNL